MEHIISATEAVLLDLLSDKQLEAMKGNEDIAKLLEARDKAKAEALVLDEFKGLLGLVELPNPPEGIYNLYITFKAESRHLGSGEREEYIKTHPMATTQDLDAKLIETGVKAWGDWIINKPTTVTSATSSNQATNTRKLAVIVKKIAGDNLELVGNFRTSKEACDYLSIDPQKGSARLALTSRSYVVVDYDGADFLVKLT